MSIHSLDRRDRRALLAGLVVVSFLVGGFRGIPAWRAWLAGSRASAGERLLQARQVETVLAAFPQTVDTLEARTQRLLSHAPALLVGETRAARATRLVDVVRNIARTSSVRVDAVEIVHDTSTAPALPRVSVDVQATGDIVGLASFLQRLDSGPTLLAIRRLRVQPERIDGPADQLETLHLQLTVEGIGLLGGDAEPGSR